MPQNTNHTVQPALPLYKWHFPHPPSPQRLQFPATGNGDALTGEDWVPRREEIKCVVGRLNSPWWISEQPKNRNFRIMPTKRILWLFSGIKVRI
jgi:hypothetical protein